MAIIRKGTEAKILGYLGAVHADIKRFDEAQMYTQRAIAVAWKLNDMQLLGSQHLVPTLNYHEQNEIPNATQHCYAAIKAYREINSTEVL